MVRWDVLGVVFHTYALKELHRYRAVGGLLWVGSGEGVAKDGQSAMLFPEGSEWLIYAVLNSRRRFGKAAWFGVGGWYGQQQREQ